MQAAVIKSRGQIPSTSALETAVQASPRGCSTRATSCSRLSRAHAARTATRRRSRQPLRGGTAGQIVVISQVRVHRHTHSALATLLATTAARSPPAQRRGRGRRPGRQPRRPDERHEVQDLARRRVLAAAIVLMLASRCGRCAAGRRDGVQPAGRGGHVRGAAAAVRRLEPTAGRPGLHGPDVDHRHLHGRVRHLGRVLHAAADAHARGVRRRRQQPRPRSAPGCARPRRQRPAPAW